jgi:hypothetical protein
MVTRGVGGMTDHVLLDLFQKENGDVGTFLLAVGADTVEAEDDQGNGEVLSDETLGGRESWKQMSDDFSTSDGLWLVIMNENIINVSSLSS